MTEHWAGKCTKIIHFIYFPHMKHKILRLIAVLILGLFVFVKGNPTDPMSIKINTFFGREQTALLTGTTDVPENLPTDLTGSTISTGTEVNP